MSGGLQTLMRNIVIGWMREAEERGYITITEGVRLNYADTWGKEATENGKPAAFNVPFLITIEKKRVAVECADVYAIMDCLDKIYADFPESEKRGHGAKILPFPAGVSA